MEEPHVETADAPEIDVTSLDDSELEKVAGGEGLDGLPGGGEPAPEPTNKDVAPDGEPAKGDAPKEPGETKPLSVEELQKQIQEIKAERDTFEKRIQDRQATIDKQGGELGELRKLKAQILERIQQRKAVDPHQQIIDDPAAFQRAAVDELQDNQRLQQIEQREREMYQQHMVAQQMQTHQRFLDQHAPDLTENIEAVAQFFLDNGATPEAVATFKQNPAAEHPGMVWSTLKLVQAQKTIADLTAQVEQLKAKPGNMLDRIEGEARRTLTNGAGAGGKKGGDLGAVSEADLASMTDDELDAVLKEANAL